MQNDMTKSYIREVLQPSLRPALLEEFLAAQRGAEVTISDEDYAEEFPLPAAHDPSTCKCGEKYNHQEFLALSIPQGSTGEWHYPASEVTIAVRSCKCGNRLGRRVV